MNRLTTLCFLLVIVCGNTVAQAPLPPDCSTPPDRQWLPISGTVVDAQEGHPIAGATVTFDWGYNTMDSSLHLYNLGVLRSKITTGPDGTFSFPVQWDGQYVVRTSAPGYLGASRSGLREPPEQPHLIVSTRRTSRCSEAIQQEPAAFPQFPTCPLYVCSGSGNFWASPS